MLTYLNCLSVQTFLKILQKKGPVSNFRLNMYTRKVLVSKRLKTRLLVAGFYSIRNQDQVSSGDTFFLIFSQYKLPVLGA